MRYLQSAIMLPGLTATVRSRVMSVDKDRLYKKLDHVGEHIVRANLANGVYGENRRNLVEEWLEQFEDYAEAEANEEDDVGEGAVEEKALELTREASERIREENRRATSKTSTVKWYQRPRRVIALAVLAALIYALIYLVR